MAQAAEIGVGIDAIGQLVTRFIRRWLGEIVG
jgi:hypothetical protein